jgi:hypothetical protein
VSQQSRLSTAPEQLEAGGRTYDLLGYDADGVPHYLLRTDMLHGEHVKRLDGDLARVGHLSDEQAEELELNESAAFGGESEV